MNKICTKCGIEKPLSEFYGNKRAKDGLYSICKVCHMNRPYYKEYYKDPKKRKNHLEANKRSRRKKIAKGICRDCTNLALPNKTVCKNHLDQKTDFQYRKTYGISLKQYNEILEKQGGVCAICGCNGNGFQRRFHLDHNHSNGKIRAILCHRCNLTLGNAKDNVPLLKKVIDYLEKYL